MDGKTWFRCTVCGDVHYGIAGPKTCPTCNRENVYIQVSLIEAKSTQKIFTDIEEIKKETPRFFKQQLRELLESYTKGKEFELNPDAIHLSLTLDGVLKNEEDTGLKYCPCQLRSDDFSSNLTLLCPCNFTIQETFINQGRCWCGLFTQRR